MLVSSLRCIRKRGPDLGEKQNLNRRAGAIPPWTGDTVFIGHGARLELWCKANKRQMSEVGIERTGAGGTNGPE